MEGVAQPDSRRPTSRQRNDRRRMTAARTAETQRRRGHARSSDGSAAAALPRRQPRLARHARRLRGDDGDLHGRQSAACFSNWSLYASVLTTLPVALFLVVPLVFVVTAGEIDLSFPATMGFAGLDLRARRSGGLRSVPRHRRGDRRPACALGLLVGSLVVYVNLSSLIATLGMNFMLRGLILIITQSKSIALVTLGESWAYTIFSSHVFGVPVQILWALAFVVFCALLFNRHRFGAQVQVVGDNPDSANEMGIDVKRVRVKAFVFMGLGAALAGVFSTMINFTWWPTSGDGYLLPVLASVFVGGTPTWGGIGTVVGGAIGALIVSFIQTGIVGAGPQRLLRPVLQRADHHPVADRPSMESNPLSVKPPSPFARETPMPFTWPNRPPADCPFPQSTALKGVTFTGRHARYTNADTWYPSWGADDVLYTPWTDGCFSEERRLPVDCASKATDASNAWRGGRSGTGQACMRGGDALRLTLEKFSASNTPALLLTAGVIPVAACARRRLVLRHVLPRRVRGAPRPTAAR